MSANVNQLPWCNCRKVPEELCSHGLHPINNDENLITNEKEDFPDAKKNNYDSTPDSNNPLSNNTGNGDSGNSNDNNIDNNNDDNNNYNNIDNNNDDNNTNNNNNNTNEDKKNINGFRANL